MKSTLRNYFFDRLSSREEKKVQEYICTNKESEELNDALRDLFDECLAPEGKQVRHVQWGRIALP